MWFRITVGVMDALDGVSHPVRASKPPNAERANNAPRLPILVLISNRVDGQNFSSLNKKCNRVCISSAFSVLLIPIK